MASVSTTPMGFRLLPCGSILTVTYNCIFADGGIEVTTPQVFEGWLLVTPVRPYTTVVLNSPGGFLGPGMKLGEEIRAHKFSTDIGRAGSGTAGVQPGDCASSCTLAFLGGIARSVRPGSRYGVHRFWFNRTVTAADVQTAQQNAADILNYMLRMGAKTELFSLMESTPSDEIKWLTAQQQLRELQVVTVPQSVFEIRQKGPSDYLDARWVNGQDVWSEMQFYCAPTGVGALVYFKDARNVNWRTVRLHWELSAPGGSSRPFPALPASFVRNEPDGRVLVDVRAPGNLTWQMLAQAEIVVVGAEAPWANVREMIPLNDEGQHRLRLIGNSCPR